MKKVGEIKARIKSLSARPLLFTFVMLALAVGAAYVADKALQVAGAQKIVTDNDAYLQESLNKSGGAFVSLSAIKAGVAVVEGSTVGIEAGVTADVQVGDAVQSIFDFIDMAWKITFFSSMTLFIVQICLQQITALGPLTMLIAFLSGAVVLAIQNWKPKALIASGVFRRICWFFLLCAAGIYAVLPITVGAARMLSTKITRPVIEEGVAAFAELQAETSSDSMNARLFPDGEKLKDKVDLKRKLNEIATWCKSLTRSLFDKGIRFCAGFLFDCLIFPGALLLTVWAVIKKGLAGQGVTNRTLREDVAGALRKLRREESEE